MEPEVSHLVSCIFLFLLIPLLPPSNSSSFQFVKQFTGSKKGDNVRGLQEIRNYLQKYGYLSYSYSKNPNYFDDTLESAVKAYQLNYHLNVSGTIDTNTLSLMGTPRCGMPDISKFNLSWALQPSTSHDVQGRIAQAFSKWASVSHFNFSKGKEFTHADLQISFLHRDHGDNSSFDGPGGVLAHVNMPPNGKLYFDAEHWAVGAVPGAVDIGTVGLHEIGHLLGLGHSTVAEAIT
ncbi:metalloendoproteinase 1-like [Camellia sinensis]|uniref:metalloendoproteinase 1-like n=1 Tax=Camellia sinensis TaxID=4442 RepID=UPI0010367C4E|nr:metalloendoproteinase 1-like [Camellia sinensis]